MFLETCHTAFSNMTNHGRATPNLRQASQKGWRIIFLSAASPGQNRLKLLIYSFYPFLGRVDILIPRIMQPRVPGILSMFSRKIHWLTENKIQHFTFKDTHIKNHAYQKYDHADQRVKAPNSTNQLHYVHSEYYFAAEAGQPLTGTTSIPFLPCQGSSCWISS